jgi:hypothetical protein
MVEDVSGTISALLPPGPRPATPALIAQDLTR